MKHASIIPIIKKYTNNLIKHGIPVESVIAFGSQITGAARYGSDIDTCIVSKSFGHDRHAERLMLMRYTDKETSAIEPHPFHPDDLSDTHNFLATEIRKHGIRVI